MAGSKTHPAPTQIEAYLAGGLSEDECELIGEHLESCSDCVEQASGLTAPDPLVRLLRSAAKTELHPSGGGSHRDTLLSEMGDTDAFGKPPVVLAEEIPAALANHPRYRVLRVLGRGGMGTVWLAEHHLLNRLVAIKSIHTEFLAKPGAAERLRREMHAVAKLSHPNVVAALDAETPPGASFLVTEYIEGKTLSELLANGPFTIPSACRAARDAALGLAHAHEAGLIHRDIKPANLIKSPSGVVKLLDLGLVAPLDGESDLTGENMVMGTADYISPEQAIDPRRADVRSDIYSLGCTLYHLLDGAPPFFGSSTLGKLDDHRWREPTPLQGIPDALWKVLAKMLAKQPGQRFATAHEVALALAPFCETNSTGKAESLRKEAPNQLSQLRKARPWPRIGLAIGFVAAFLALAGFAIYRIQTDRGEIIVETFADDVQVEIKRNGKTIIVRDVKSGEKLTLRSGKYEITGKSGGSKIVFEPHEITISRGSVIARVRQLAKGDPPLPFPAAGRQILQLPQSIRKIAFSPDSARIELVCCDGTAKIVDRETGELKTSFQHKLARDYANRVTTLQRFANDTKLLTSNRYGVYAWDLAKGTELFSLLIPDEDQILRAAISDDESLIACSCQSGKVRIFNSQTRELVNCFDGNGNPAYYVRWLPGSHRLVMSQDVDLRVVDLDDGKELLHLIDQGIWLEPRVSPNQTQLAVMVWSGNVVVIDLKTYLEVHRFHCRHIDDLSHYTLCYLPDGKMATGGGNMLDICDPLTGKRLYSLEGFEGDISHLAASPDGKWLAAGGENGALRVWRIPSSSNLEVPH